MKDSAAVTGW